MTGARGLTRRQLVSAVSAVGALAALSGCSTRQREARLPASLAGQGVVALVFFAPRCGVLEAHDDRLKKMAATYGPRGARLVLVVSEREAELSRTVIAERGLPSPPLVDQGGELADALSVRYSSHSVVFDAQGRVAYQGGIDSDMVELHADARTYLADALDDVLAGRPPRVAEAKTLGCPLRR